MLYRRKMVLIPFMGPTLILIALFLYYPFAMNIVNSMFKLSTLLDTISTDNFIGIKNYTDMFSDKVMGTSVVNTFLIMIFTLVFQVGLALVLALMVDSIKKGQQFFRSVFFFPVIVSATAIGLLFNLFYEYRNGMLNQIITFFGGERILWMEAGAKAFTAITIPVIWSYVGFYFVLLVTGLSNISDDIYESASIDGATGFKKTRYITVPLLLNVIKTCMILAITGALKVFDLPWIIAPKGLGDTYVLGTYMYFNAFLSDKIGYASAISIVIVVVGVIISQITNVLLKQEQF